MVALSANHVQIPRISGTIDRPRLINKLRTAADHRLTIVSAPPGFGKTTLVAQFARELPYPIVWHTIEERERDVPSLFAQCVRAFSHVVPSILGLNPAPGTPPNELATLVTNHLRKYMLTDTLYILDDVHNLAGSLGAEAWLRALIAMLPSKCHLIVVSRILPDLPLTEMIARGDVLAIGQRELQFTPQEAKELASQISPNVTSAAEIDDITARLEGWPAGIVLALHPLPSDLEQVMLSGGTGPEALFDALANLMLNAQTAKLRSFLLSSSTLKRLTPELCAEVLQWTDGLYWMESVQSRNLFASKTPGGLMYHGLFRDFLQRQLKESDAGLFTRLHAKAGDWFERSNQPDEAFEHYLSADERVRAAALSETLAQSYFTQGRTETLLRWASQLDEVELHPPKLLYTCAMIETDRYEYESAEEKLNYAENEFTARHNVEGVRSVQLQQATISLQKGDYTAAIGQAQYLLEDKSLVLNLRARSWNLIGIGQLRLGKPEAAIRSLETAIPLYRQDGDDYALSHSLQNLELAYTRLGRLDDAGACLQEVVAIRRSLQSSGALALALNNLGYHYHLRSDYEQALATFEEGVSIGAQVPDKRAEGYLLWSLGDLQRDLGNFDDALRLYAKGIELIGAGEPSLRSSILISASILRRWQRQYDEAIAHAEEAVSLATIHNLGLEFAFAQAMMQAAYGMAAPSEIVLQQLDAVCDDLRQQGAQLELMRVIAVQTNISLLMGDNAAAHRYLQIAQETAETASVQQPFAAEVIQAPLLKAFVSSAGKRGFAQRELKSLQEAQSKLCHQRP
ncbi:MAG: tetratricopeptide repeat protein, partial [Burkholderiales bacterium]|nr:tetratricopeptide repeat protein [Anaerolineae bacterium]